MKDRKEYKKAWAKANKEKVATQQKAWYEKNKEKVLLATKAYRVANKDSIKDYLAANKDKKRVHAKTYRDANKEKLAAIHKNWLNKNKAKFYVTLAKRRLLKANAEAAMSDAEKENYANLVEIRDNATALFGYAWHIDHVIPLSKGGTNAIDNLEVVPASWNLSKNNLNSDSFWG